MASEREQLRQLVPNLRISPENERRLAEAPASALCDLVLDSDEPWWRREKCARALAGRVPAERTGELLGAVRDPEVTTNARVALLDVLSDPGAAHAPELLAWLRSQDGVEQSHGLAPAIVAARARLGDLGATHDIVALEASAWSRLRAIAEPAVDALIEVRGLEAVLAELGADSIPALATAGANAAERLLGLRLLYESGADITCVLADTDFAVARAAYERLAESSDHEGQLVAMIGTRRPGHLWALAVLARRGHDIEPAWEVLGRPRVELPGVPADVREAILREYAPGQRDTDPRWLLEAACLPPPPSPAEPREVELPRRATDALAAAGLAPETPISAGDLHDQGDGTYYVIGTAAGTMVVSTLGPYFRQSRTDNGQDTRAVDALRAAGSRYIDDELAGTRFEGLAVYFFGSREPLSVDDLLFYWQD